MKRLSATLVIFLCLTAHGQNTDRIEMLINQQRIQIDSLTPHQTQTTTPIDSRFAEGIMNEKSGEIEALTVEKVYYVYTQYRKSDRFIQKDLDRKRFERLAQAYPDIIDDYNIQWQLLEQTACKDYTEGDNYFHGFVLVHRPATSEEERAAEIKRLMSYMDNPADKFDEPNIDRIEDRIQEKKEGKPTTPKRPDVPAKYGGGDFSLYRYLQENVNNTGDVALKRDDRWVNSVITVDQFGRIARIQIEDEDCPKYIKDRISQAFREMPDWEPAIADGDSVSSEVRMEVRVSYSRSVNGMFKRDGVKPSFIGDENQAGLLDNETQKIEEKRRQLSMASSAVFRGMELIDSTERVAIIMDVTGSMTPNIAALNWWISNNPDSSRVTSYTFFNDGNNMPTHQKKIGYVGGIYTTLVKAEVRETVEKAMLAGGGGERPESDIEALLHAQNQDKGCDALVLVGDNFSEVRDMTLLKQINKKVHVLVCSAPKAPRVDYLDIAKETGGDLFLNGVRYPLASIAKGEKLTIDAVTYVYNGRGFRMKKD